jgi:hypothetical protein
MLTCRHCGPVEPKFTTFDTLVIKWCPKCTAILKGPENLNEDTKKQIEAAYRRGVIEGLKIALWLKGSDRALEKLIELKELERSKDG